MDSTLVINNSHTYCKNLQVIKTKHYVHAPRGIDWQEKTIARPRPPLIRMTIKETPHTSNLSHNGYHTCMLRDLQTSTQVFLNFTITQLAQLSYHHLYISKQLSSIKLLLVCNALFMKVFIIPILDAYHIRTNFIAKANYHAVLKDSQNNISKA